MIKRCLALCGVLLFFAVPAAAISITIDESGNGLPFRIGTDPGPGGLSNVLIYTLPFAGTQGDILVFDADLGLVLDVLRFNGDGTLIFYSDNIGGVDNLGDTPGPPGVFYTNRLTIPEVGAEGDNGALYTPLLGQPGFDAGSAPAFHFVSDSGTPVPEPTSLILLGTGLFGFAGRRWRNGRNR